MARKAKKVPGRNSAAKKSTAKSKTDKGTGQNRISNLEREALALHAGPPPGKLSIAPLKAIRTQRDLSLAY